MEDISTGTAHPTTLDDTPRWAVVWAHEQKWQFYRLEIMLRNTAIYPLVPIVCYQCDTARILNARCIYAGDRITPLPLPIQTIPLPTIPDPPAAGSPPKLPPAFYPAPIVIPTPHPLFPATKGVLLGLDSKQIPACSVRYLSSGSRRYFG
ncbi:hypothetical protein B0H11DRAFT_2004682 [Mycena galericulata]|nr:hypothetical protein B0H11DRAFT_2004682 [Mycena galericulata]